MTRKETLALFPGTFDPITNGHVDIIRRAAALFDRVVVAVGENPDKSALLPAQERSQVIGQVIAGLSNVSVQTFRGLTVELAKKLGATTIVRGIRNSSDLHFEYQVAMTNRAAAGVETIFLLTSPEHAFTSSSLIKQVVRMGGDVSKMVPQEVLPHLPKGCGGGEDVGLKDT